MSIISSTGELLLGKTFVCGTTHSTHTANTEPHRTVHRIMLILAFWPNHATVYPIRQHTSKEAVEFTQNTRRNNLIAYDELDASLCEYHSVVV